MRPRLTILGIIIPIVFALDQITKRWIVSHIPQGSFLSVIPGIFDIVHTHNRGAAFGFMAGLPDSVRLPFFFIVSFLALTLITLYFFRLNDPRLSLYICLALILGGAAGNIWDRVFLGEVIDFLSFHWYDKIVQWQIGPWALRFRLEWPAFNVADSAISCAVVWLIGLMMKSPPGKKEIHK